MKRLRNDGTPETQFTMRLENGVYEKVKESAKQNRRSAAKEIEYALSIYYSTLKIK